MTEQRAWLLTEAAAATGLTVEAIRQRVKRRQIVAFKGNDGLLRVRLADDEIEALKTGRPTSRPTGQPTEQPTGHEVLREAIAVLERQLTAVRKDLETAAQNATVEREKLTQERQSILADLRQSQTQLANTLKSEGDARAERDCLRVERETGEKMAAERHQAAQEKIADLQAQLAEATRPRSFWERLFLR